MAPHATDESHSHTNGNTSAPPNGLGGDNPDSRAQRSRTRRSANRPSAYQTAYRVIMEERIRRPSEERDELRRELERRRAVRQEEINRDFEERDELRRGESQLEEEYRRGGGGRELVERRREERRRTEREEDFRRRAEEIQDGEIRRRVVEVHEDQRRQIEERLRRQTEEARRRIGAPTPQSRFRAGRLGASEQLHREPPHSAEEYRQNSRHHEPPNGPEVHHPRPHSGWHREPPNSPEEYRPRPRHLEPPNGPEVHHPRPHSAFHPRNRSSSADRGAMVRAIRQEQDRLARSRARYEALQAQTLESLRQRHHEPDPPGIDDPSWIEQGLQERMWRGFPVPPEPTRHPRLNGINGTNGDQRPIQNGINGTNGDQPPRHNGVNGINGNQPPRHNGVNGINGNQPPRLNGINGINGVNGYSHEGEEASQDEHSDEDDKDASGQPMEQPHINGVHEDLDENDDHEQRDTGESNHMRSWRRSPRDE
ncbi:hypothetical protein J3E68DRAFT_100674 [Trichoderma sp. SZMC 28012]